MVGILAFALGSLVTMFFVMAKNGQRNADLDLPEFPEEEVKDKPITPKGKNKSLLEDWERDADWWK